MVFFGHLPLARSKAAAGKPTIYGISDRNSSIEGLSFSLTKVALLQ
jgi:hypothetical protein